jgi:O-antigen ligase
VSLLFTFPIVATYVDGNYFGLAIVLSVIGLVAVKKRRFMVVGFIIAAIAIILQFQQVQDHLYYAFEGSIRTLGLAERNAVHRVHFLWPRALRHFAQNPLLGIGAWNSWRADQLPSGPHNVPLLWLSEGGVIGAGLGLYLVFSIFRFLWRSYNAQAAGLSSRIASLALLASFAGIWGRLLTHDGWFNLWWPFFMAILGILSSCANRLTD